MAKRAAEDRAERVTSNGYHLCSMSRVPPVPGDGSNKKVAFIIWVTGYTGCYEFAVNDGKFDVAKTHLNIDFQS